MLRDHEDVAMIVWKMLLHAQLPRDCQEKGPAAVMLMQRTRLSRDRNPRASKVYDTGYHTPESLKSVHGCLSIPPGLGILGHLRILDCGTSGRSCSLSLEGFAQKEGEAESSLRAQRVPAATTGCRHCPAKGAGASVDGVSFTLFATQTGSWRKHGGSRHSSSMLTAAHVQGRRPRSAGACLSDSAENKAAAGRTPFLQS